MPSGQNSTAAPRLEVPQGPQPLWESLMIGGLIYNHCQCTKLGLEMVCGTSLIIHMNAVETGELGDTDSKVLNCSQIILTVSHASSPFLTHVH